LRSASARSSRGSRDVENGGEAKEASALGSVCYPAEIKELTLVDYRLVVSSLSVLEYV
jgi:hypothetical protein